MKNITLEREQPSYTRKEIEGQPVLWKSVYEKLLLEEEQIERFLSPLIAREHLQIILTGAGSSAFVGEAAQGIVQKNTGCLTRAIATTDIVTHPELFFPSGNTPVLLISFARSGNSPESVEAINLANSFCKEIYHLVITCNKDGELYQYTKENTRTALAILLPDQANDRSLAMTGSFTSMLLSVLLITSQGDLKSKQQQVLKMIRQGESVLDDVYKLQLIAEKDFDRVVFLGSGPLLGIARECHLKLQELSDGRILCKHDSFLGFRHGPRAVVNEKTLVVYLFSASDHVYKYERDLALSISQDIRDIMTVSLGRKADTTINSLLTMDLNLQQGEEFNCVPTTMIGQILGYFKSLQLGLDPDNPSKSGAISRVVQGVIIYEFPQKQHT